MNRGNGPGPAAATSNQTRAQKFESEKQRIQESCFSKVDEHGQQAESYITHLRIEEDGAYPSLPPPPESPADNKKARVIVVAVRSTGRVRVHKARENHNGSFSIGKTWNLEDLSAVESFNYIAPDDDQQRRLNCQRAGQLGFVVTISKPYYWKASTPKERDFFIASLVKIFKKYTKGRVPLLKGFSDEEHEQMFGTPQVTLQNLQHRPSEAGTVPHPPFDRSTGAGLSSYESEQRNRSISRDHQTPTAVTSAESPNPTRQLASFGSPVDRNYGGSRPADHRRQSSSDRGRPSDQGLGIRKPPSTDPLRPGNDALRGAANGSISPQESRSESRQPRRTSPAPSQTSTSSRTASTPGKTFVPSFTPQRSGIDSSRTNGDHRDRWAPVSSGSTPEMNGSARRPVGADRNLSADSKHATIDQAKVPSPQDLPERRRPPIAVRDLEQASSFENANLKPPPLSMTRSPSSATSLGRNPSTTFTNTPTESVLSSPGEELQRDKSPSRKPVPSSKSTEALVSPLSDATADAKSPEPDSAGDTAARPGLGPMFKKRDVASTFRKAAVAATAFKPRAGGAGERLKQQQTTTNGNENDGVRGVAPAPLRSANLEASRNNSVVSATESEKPESPPFVRKGSAKILETLKGTFKSQSPAPVPQIGDTTPDVDALGITTDTKQESRAIVKPKRRTAQQERYIASLGIDPALFENKGLDFEAILTEFGWGSEILQQNKLEYLENDIKREIGRVEAGSWLYHMEQKDDRVGMVDRMLDRAIAECDELDGLLTLYSVELNTLNEDIAFIEAQSQGLQVQTANQKILHAELQKLVYTISITTEQLSALEHGSFEHDLEKIEANLRLLYKALITIDPTVRSTSVSHPQSRLNDKSEASELANMHALQEKRDQYLADSDRFCQRLLSRLGTAFDVSLKQAIPMLMKPSASGRSAPWNLHPQACNATRSGLWQYGPLILYTKEINQSAWRHLLNTYTDIARPLFYTVFQTALDSHRKNTRPPTGEEADVLFTTAEKESDATRKLNIKRSHTLLSKATRTTGDKARMLQAGRQSPSEAFADMLREWAPTLAMEQNFVTELFHATSLENIDFDDAVQVAPEQRRGPADMVMPRQAEPDRNVADHVQRAMASIFEFWPAELLKLIDQSLVTDPIQAVGMLASIAVFSAPLHETSQEFLLRSLDDSTAKLEISFQRFVDAQIRAIEDTKVMLKKRKGIISFIRTFPVFAIAVENTFTTAARSAGNSPAVGHVRGVVDDAYERINQSMWVSLKQIAKEIPSAGSGSGANGQSTEAEDKEVLNYHILLIENMTHYIEEVDDGGDSGSVLATWKGKAQTERAEHLDSYVKRVVRRPLGKLLDFLESTEALLLNSPNPSAVANKPSHGRSAAKRVLSAHDSGSVRKGIDALRKRVDKHFADHALGSGGGGGEGGGSTAEERAVALKLVELVLDACEREYLSVLERTVRVCADVYPAADKGVDVEFGRDDILAGFRR